MLGGSMRWLLERGKVQPDDLYVHLFASDQPEPPITAEVEWRKDSIFLAKIIERHLKQRGLAYTAVIERGGIQHEKTTTLRLPGRQIRIHSIPGNPADYRNMLDYFTRELARLTQWVGEDGRVYLEVTGGTPAMASMMMVAGVETFGRQTHTLYSERGADRPYRVGIGRRFFARRAREVLRGQLELYAYKAARATLDRETDLIVRDGERRKLIAALLDYADRRLAFDFERAREALHEARQYATGSVQSRVQYHQRELREEQDGIQSRAALLAELIHSTTIKYEWGDYADFSQRLFRFQEAVLRYLAEQMGLEYDDGNDRFASMNWVKGVPELKAFLDTYPVGSGQRGIKLNRTLNRASLGAIVDFFVERVERWTFLKPTVERIGRLSRLASLRNRGLAGHGFEGIGKDDLSQAFGGEADKIIPLLKQIYAAVFEREVGPNPYHAVNKLIGDLLEA
jgi:hypothetical protein